jgi:hypothetical protein
LLRYGFFCFFVQAGFAEHFAIMLSHAFSAEIVSTGWASRRRFPVGVVGASDFS